MNVESECMGYAPTEGAAPLANVSDVEMVAVLESSGAKIMRNVQTQHGDYRSVDAENIFLIARCLWPDDDMKPAPLLATTSKDDGASASASASGCADQEPAAEETEQVVWVEPLASEVNLLPFLK